MFDQFRLHHCILELRYPEAYLLWDRAGKLATHFARKFKDMKMLPAEPGHFLFQAENKYRIEVRLDRAHMTAFESQFVSKKTIADLMDVANQTLSELDIGILTRIGTRFEFRQKMPDIGSMESELKKMNFAKSISFTSLDIEPKRFMPELRFKVDNGDLGYAVIIGGIEQKVNVDLPLGMDDENLDILRESCYIKLDIDYYTMKDTPSSAFNTELWFDKVTHAIRRDADKILKAIAT